MDQHPCEKVSKFLLFYDDFRCGFNPGQCGSPYSFFSAPNLVAANDAAGGVTISPNSLTISSSPFTYTNPTGVDHVKYLVYQPAYETPSNGIELVYEGIISVQQTGLNNLPSDITGALGGITGVNNVNSDIRLASAAFNILDPDNLMVFDFFLSNEDIYAFYERLPFNRTDFGGPGPNYTAFSHAIPVGKRNVADPGNDFVKLAIAYNYKDNMVRWIINDIEVFRVNRIGLPIERKYRIIEHNIVGQVQSPATLIRSKRLQPGFGTFSLMDGYNPQNPGQVSNAGLVNLSAGTLPYVDPVNALINGNGAPPTFLTNYNGLGVGTTGTNFGQGSILRIKYISVYYLAAEENIRLFKELKQCKKELLLSRCYQNMIPGVNSVDNVVSSCCKGKINTKDNCEKPCKPQSCPCNQRR